MKPKKKSAINELLRIMARLRAPNGCPWDREQDHRTLRRHAIEEVYELIDAIEAGDDHEMAEELGDLLLQVVFHSQMAKERGAFDFEQVCQCLVDKLIHRHPHVFGDRKIHTAEAVLAQWDRLKHAEKKGTRRERQSALDGIPKHLPALLRAEKLVKKARKANLLQDSSSKVGRLPRVRLAKQLFALAESAQRRGWSAEELLAAECRQKEKLFRQQERKGG
jgi:XTP/dITP diphosphohydrolase